MTGALALLAGCGQAPERGGTDAAEPAPDIGVTAVPGVSIDYDYSFRIPVRTLQTVQERHAASCESLGPARCRITGMTYSVDGQRRISASLALRLAPELARRFGREAAVAVTAAGGMLTDAEITSRETGAALESVAAEATSRGGERAGIDRQLARPGLPAAERTQLQARRQQLIDADRGAGQAMREGRRELAGTPMTFHYASGAVDAQLTDGPLLGALKDGWANIVAGVALLLMLAITLLPWAAALLLAIWLYRRFVVPFLGRAAPKE